MHPSFWLGLEEGTLTQHGNEGSILGLVYVAEILNGRDRNCDSRTRSVNRRTLQLVGVPESLFPIVRAHTAKQPLSGARISPPALCRNLQILEPG